MAKKPLIRTFKIKDEMSVC